MYTPSFHNFLFLWGLCYAFSQALTIPETHRDSLVYRDNDNEKVKDLTLENVGIVRPVVNDPSVWSPIWNRSPAKAKPKPKPKPKPTAKPKPTSIKPTPTKLPPAKPTSNKSVQTKPTTKSTAKPTTKTATATSTSTPTKNLKWPVVKVPYPTKAFDTCDVFVSCEQDLGGDGLVARGINAAREFTITLKPSATPLPAHLIEKREIRTFKPDINNPTFKIESLDYPSGSNLYEGPKGQGLKVHVFDFKTTNVDDVAVTDSSTKPTDKTGLKWVTEHIVELQTVMMFIEKVVSSNAALGAFFSNHWNQVFTPQVIGARAQKPSIETNDAVVTLNGLVFQAMGSNYNREDFVVCDHEINSYKARIWDQKAPMELNKYNLLVTDALSGALSSNAYQSVLRNTIGVFEYMAAATVQTKLKDSVKNVKIELSNAQGLTGQTIASSLAGEWETFIKGHLLAIEKFGKEWLTTAIDATQKRNQAAITKYRTLHTALEKKEGRHLPQNGVQQQHLVYAQNQIQEKNRQEAVITTKKSAETALDKKIKTGMGGLVALDKQYRAEKNDVKKKNIKAERTQEAKVVLANKKKLLAIRKDIGKRSQAVEELFSTGVQGILTNLDRDKAVLAKFETIAKGLKMPKLA